MFKSGSRSNFRRKEVDIKDLIVDEDGLDVLYWKKLKNIDGSIHQEPEVRVKNRKGGGSSSSRGQLLPSDSGGGAGDRKSAAALGGSSSSRGLFRSQGLGGRSSGVAFQAVTYSNGVVGDWNRPTDLGDRSSSSSQLLPGQRFEGRNSGVPPQDSANYGGGVGVGLPDSANYGGGVGVPLQASANSGGGFGVPLQNSANSVGRFGIPHQNSANSGGGVGVPLQASANYSGGVGGAFQTSENYGGGVGGAFQASANSGGGVGVPFQNFANSSGGVGGPFQASANYGGGVGGAFQASANSGGGVGVPFQNFAYSSGGVGVPFQNSANSGGGVGVPFQNLASSGGGVGVAIQALAISGGGFGAPLPPGYLKMSSTTVSSAAASSSTAVSTTPAQTPAAPPPPAPVKKAPPPPPPPAPAKKAPMAPPPPPPGKKPPGPPKPPGKGSKKPEASFPALGADQKMLKPLHWEKLNVNPEHSMVWDKFERGSFQYSEDKIEALFGFAPTNRKPGMEDNPNSKSSEASNVKVFILDPRKSRNTAIVLKSLGTPRSELIDSLLEGSGLSIETLEKLQRTVPTHEEESEIMAYDGDPAKLADAESFLYGLLKAVPLAYTRASTMLFKLNYKTEILNVKESLQPMEPACNELRSHVMFEKLLEAILKAGNRLNAGTARGGAKAFNLMTLPKLSDFKGSDGKTTLLSFVVQEVASKEGRRIDLARKKDTESKNDSDSAAPQPDDPVDKEEKEKEVLQLGLPVVSRLSSELLNVKKAASMDYDVIKSNLASLKNRLDETRQLVSQCRSSSVGGGFLKEMEGFLESAEVEMKALQDENTRVFDLVLKTTQYYQAGSSNRNPLQLFIIVKDFLGMVDQTCAAISRALQTKKPAAGATSAPSSSTQQDVLRTRVAFPSGIKEQILLVNKSRLSVSSDSEDDDF